MTDHPWISVNERLPENDDDCWVCTANKEVMKSWLWADWIRPISLDVIENVTHWMPWYTPDPPGIEEECHDEASMAYRGRRAG